MKQNILFKTLIDLLFFVQCFGLIGVIVILPSNLGTISQAEVQVVNWNFNHWCIFIISSLSYILFLIGLYYLRKMARNQLSNRPYENSVSTNLKKSGSFFIANGILSILVIVVVFIIRLTNNKLQFTYDENTQFSVFAIIIGLFFIIQSNTIKKAKELKQENDLTV
tara:strand:- start:231 stop:728 length:498 start_codon:yes stop_codon:yes gene_type:complete